MCICIYKYINICIYIYIYIYIYILTIAFTVKQMKQDSASNLGKRLSWMLHKIYSILLALQLAANNKMEKQDLVLKTNRFYNKINYYFNNVLI